MREQRGYLFHRDQSWFVRFMDDVMQPDGTFKRKLVTKKLDVRYGGEYRTKKSVQPFVDPILAPINSGKLNPSSTQTVCDFVDRFTCPSMSKRISGLRQTSNTKTFGKTISSRAWAG